MGDSRAAGFDRLPWLADEDASPARRSLSDQLAWAVPLTLAIAAASFLLGVRDGRKTAFDGSPAPRSTLALPEARELQPEMPPLSTEPSVVPAPPPSLPAIAEPKIERTAPVSVKRASAKPEAAPPKPSAKAATPTYTKTPWPVRRVEGSSGRLVRVGTFASRAEAKRGWRALMRVNPALQRLPALVVAAPSARNGETYYRLQMGTTSQAHSTVLCQRMRMIGQSCIVVTDAAAA